MQLQILVSKKGTQVITSSNLHEALQLPVHKYNANIEKWLSDCYGFHDDIRRPTPLQDYAARQLKVSKRKDYYLSLELARLITLNSQSPVKLKYAKWLRSVEAKAEGNSKFSKEQILAVVELTKAMGMVSCQKSVEKHHMRTYQEKHGFPSGWWEYRAKVLGYSAEELKAKMEEVGQNYKGKNLLQMLMQVDKYEIIRMAVMDLFLALGKDTVYAKNIGDLAKVFAKEMKIEIWDDRKAAIQFNAKNVDPNLIQEVLHFKRGAYLSAL